MWWCWCTLFYRLNINPKRHFTMEFCEKWNFQHGMEFVQRSSHILCAHNKSHDPFQTKNEPYDGSYIISWTFCCWWLNMMALLLLIFIIIISRANVQCIFIKLFVWLQFYQIVGSSKSGLLFSICIYISLWNIEVWLFKWFWVSHSTLSWIYQNNSIEFLYMFSHWNGIQLSNAKMKNFLLFTSIELTCSNKYVVSTAATAKV